MNTLTSSFDYKNKKIELNLAYNRVLKFYKLMKDTDASNQEKIKITLKLFVKNYDEIASLSFNDKSEIIKIIHNDFIEIKSKKSSNDKNILDFDKDFTFIYSSFMQDYQIDLYDQADKLDWRKFIYLFVGLSDKTKIMQVMSIRAREMPKPTKYNSEEIAQLYKLKAYYSLDDEGDKQKGLDSLFNIARGRANAKQ
jgi:hypothetical protein